MPIRSKSTRLRRLALVLLVVGSALLVVSLSGLLGTTQGHRQATQSVEQSLIWWESHAQDMRIRHTYRMVELPGGARVSLTVWAETGGRFEVWAPYQGGAFQGQPKVLVLERSIEALEYVNVSFTAPYPGPYTLWFDIADPRAIGVQVFVQGEYRYETPFFDPLRTASLALLGGLAATAAVTGLLIVPARG